MEEMEESSETAEAHHESDTELTQYEEMHKTQPSDVPFLLAFVCHAQKAE